MRNLALMSDEPTPLPEIERMAKANGWSIAALCRAAEINPSSFGRWKRGENGMTVKTYVKLIALAKKPADQVAA